MHVHVLACQCMCMYLHILHFKICTHFEKSHLCPVHMQVYIHYPEPLGPKYCTTSTFTKGTKFCFMQFRYHYLNVKSLYYVSSLPKISTLYNIAIPILHSTQYTCMYSEWECRFVWWWGWVGIATCMCQMVCVWWGCFVCCQGGAEMAVVFLVWAASHVLYTVK